MRTTQTAVFSVIHPASAPFFSANLSSLASQSEKNFDLLLLVDNVSNINELIQPYQDFLTIHLLHRTGSIPYLRMEAIEWLEGCAYDFVIFSDSDDINAPDRVQVCCNALERHPVVVNDVTPFTEETNLTWKGYWEGRLAEDYIFSSHDIERFNFMGLGNTAVRREVITKTNIPESIGAVDWFLFYLWMHDLSGVFSHAGVVGYRQHQSNLIGLDRITKKRIEKTLDTKLAHYNALSNNFPHLKKFIGENLQKHQLIKDDRFLSRILEELNANDVNYFWWEETEYIHE